jgi:hypothetical protein
MRWLSRIPRLYLILVMCGREGLWAQGCTRRVPAPPCSTAETFLRLATRKKARLTSTGLSRDRLLSLLPGGACPRDRRSSSGGRTVDTFVRREDAERFMEEVRSDDPALASYLQIEERELETGADEPAKPQGSAGGSVPQLEPPALVL